MRSFILPVALLAASAMAAPYAGKPDCETKGNTVIEYYDVTVTEVVYYTPKPEYHAAPAHTTSRKKHKHHKPKPTAAPQPSGYVVTITEGYQPAPQPTYSPAPAPYSPPPVEYAPAPQAPSEKPSKSGDFVKDTLDLHNYYRAQHGAAPLTWDSGLANTATNYAPVCAMVHSGGPNGENLAEGTNFDGYDSTDMWYGEVSMYHGQGWDENTGHYTQVIWKDTTHLGCGSYDCGGGNIMVVCEYSPPGNVIGAFDQNCS